MNLVRIFVAFAFLVLLVSSSFNAEAEKDPVWTWSSSSSITNVAISSDSKNISATYAQSVSCGKMILLRHIILTTLRLWGMVFDIWKCLTMVNMF